MMRESVVVTCCVVLCCTILHGCRRTREWLLISLAGSM